MARLNPPKNAGNGRFMSTKNGTRLDNPERDHEAARLRRDGYSYQAIADKLGYYDSSGAHKAVQRAIASIPKEPTREVFDMELQRLDHMYMLCMITLEAENYVVSNGKLMYMGSEPLKDNAVVLQCLDRMLKIQERRAKLLGLDAPSKSRVEVVTDDVAQVMVAELEAEIAKLGEIPAP